MNWLKILLLSSLVASPLLGQDKPRDEAAGSDDSAEATAGAVSEAITVTASRAEVRALETLPLSVTVLDEATLEATPALTVDELLRTVPGLQLPPTNSVVQFPANPSVGTRGVGLGDNGTRTLVLLDGAPMNGAFFGNVFWNRLPRQSVQRVEVVRGSSSSLFGSFAMGGTVHLITRSETDHAFEAEGRAGSDSTWQLHLGGGGATEALRWRLSGNAFDTDGYFIVPQEQRGPIDRPARADHRAFQGFLEYEPASGTVLSVHADSFDQEQDGASRLSRTETEIESFRVRVAKTLGGRGLLQGRFFYTDEFFAADNVSTFPPGTREGEFVSNTHDTPAEDVGGSIEWSRAFTGKVQSFALGADYRRLEGRDESDVFVSDGTLVLTKDGEGEQAALGLFAEASFFPTSKVEVLASVRQDFFESRDGRDISSGVVTQFPDKEFDELNPRLAVRYQPTASVGIRGAVYRGFRAPTLAELYRAFGTSTFRGLPNAQLDPEVLTGGEVGLDLRRGPFQGSLNAFYTEVEDLVGGVAVSFFPVFTLQNFNIGESRSRGWEVILVFEISERWSLHANYAYTDAEITANEDDPTLVGNRVEGAPEDAVNLEVRFRQATGGARGLVASLRGRHVSEQFQDATNTTRLPSYTVFDLFASYPLSEHFAVFGTAENLLNEEYVANAFGGLDRLGAPRQLLGGLRFRWQ